MEIQISLPVDEDGFLRRECPSCERQFKSYFGETADRPEDFLEPENYFCPYCGEPSGHDTWWTKQQLEYMQSAAVGPMLEEVTDELGRAFGNIRNDFIKFDVKPPDPPEPPMPLIEPNDMLMVAPPCHRFEPIKVLEDWTEPLNCFMCGDSFTV